MQKKFEKPLPRNKRTPVPMTRPEFLALRNYAARKDIPMSRVLLLLVDGALSEIQNGYDPLPDFGGDQV